MPTIVYPVRDLNFKILIKCPFCGYQFDRFEKKQLNNNLPIKDTKDLQINFKQGNKQYVQECPECSFIIVYKNLIKNKEEIIEVKESGKCISQLENK